MKKEVSCKPFTFCISYCKKHNIDLRLVFKKLPYDIDYFKNPYNRITWNEYCQIMENMREIMTDDELVDVGKEWAKSRYYRPWGILQTIVIHFGRSIPVAQHFLKFASQVFGGISLKLKEFTETGVIVTLKTREGYKHCPTHFIITKGNCSIIVKLFGYKETKVDMKWIDRGVEYIILVPRRNKPFNYIYKKVFWFFSAKSTVNEIITSHNILINQVQELDNLSQELKNLREKERTRIASDLHDEIGSSLSTIAIIADSLQKSSTNETAGLVKLKQISDIARQTEASIRDIIWLINPSNDSLQHLVSKMRETANMLLENMDFTFEFEHDSDVSDLTIVIRRNLFLFFKECMNNVFKHAKADKVSINIFLKNNNLELTISDNGSGFDTQKEYNGNGLINLQIRSQEMNGTFKLNSTPGKGTDIKLNITIP